jgi:hydroxypyruvate reductase
VVNYPGGAAAALARADSGTFLDEAGALISTGPTGTNVMDLVIALKTVG